MYNLASITDYDIFTDGEEGGFNGYEGKTKLSDEQVEKMKKMFWGNTDTTGFTE